MTEQLLPGRAPEAVALEGTYCRLEPLTPAHAPCLFATTSGEGEAARYRYMLDEPPVSETELAARIAGLANQNDQIHFAVIDSHTRLCAGRQAFFRIRPEHRSVEIGAVMWGRGVAGTRIATESLYLFARHVFEDLGYYRFEWKCNALNAPSRRAAIRFGFRYEGLFRKDMITKQQHRDTAWFAMTDEDWADLKPLYEAWLDPENFDAAGMAKTRLATPRL